MNTEYLTFVTYTNSYGEQITECENITNVAVTDNKDSLVGLIGLDMQWDLKVKIFVVLTNVFRQIFFGMKEVTMKVNLNLKR